MKKCFAYQLTVLYPLLSGDWLHSGEEYCIQWAGNGAPRSYQLSQYCLDLAVKGIPPTPPTEGFSSMSELGFGSKYSDFATKMQAVVRKEEVWLPREISCPNFLQWSHLILLFCFTCLSPYFYFVLLTSNIVFLVPDRPIFRSGGGGTLPRFPLVLALITFFGW